jgi:hypothetical protein
MGDIHATEISTINAVLWWINHYGTSPPEFQRVFGWRDGDYYGKHKFELMQRDFPGFWFELDHKNRGKLIAAAREQYDIEALALELEVAVEKYG